MVFEHGDFIHDAGVQQRIFFNDAVADILPHPRRNGDPYKKNDNGQKNRKEAPSSAAGSALLKWNCTNAQEYSSGHLRKLINTGIIP